MKQDNEDLIIFPFKEFDKFYNKTVQNLNVVKRIIKDSLNPESTTKPAEDLKHVEDWINLIKKDMGLLIKFDVQTTLNSFYNKSSKKIKPPKKVGEVTSIPGEQMQCLIGLL